MSRAAWVRLILLAPLIVGLVAGRLDPPFWVIVLLALAYGAWVEFAVIVNDRNPPDDR